MNRIISVLAVIALLAIAVFAIQNLEPVEVSFLVWRLTLSKCLVVIGAYLLGMISGGSLVQLFKRWMAARRSAAS
jgi:uncharacterized integral membrane protein